MKFLYKKTNSKINSRQRKLFAIVLLFLSVGASAQNYTVNSTADGSGTNQLRGALQTAAGIAGSHTITVQAGTYNLSLGEIAFGNKPNVTININGAGAATTIINVTANAAQDRIFLINPSGGVSNIAVSISGITFSGGKVNFNSPDGVPYGGGAILAGGPGNSLTVSNCVFQNNTVPVNCGNGGAIAYNGGGTLSIDQTTFTGNTDQDGNGGAVYYLLENNLGVGSGSLSITNSTFTNNSVTKSGAAGGAVAVTTQPQAAGATFSASINKNNFTGNQASGTGGMGGAVGISNAFATGNTVTAQYNRFVNNTATASPSAFFMYDQKGSVDATNNWWGCNGGPSACADVAAKGAGSAGGSLNISNWLQLKLSASPTSICPSSTSLVTASFLSNSANNSIAAANLSALNGVAIGFTPASGSLSGAQTTIQSTGTATVTYTAGTTPGTGTVNATVDNVPVNDATAKTSITIITPGIWLGTSNSSWLNAANWNCGVPTATTNVTISAGAPNMPIIDAAGAIANNITINSGASLSFSGNNLLELKGTISGAGTFNPTNGSIKLSSTSAQTVPAGTYYNLFIEGGSAKTMASNVTVTNLLTLTSGFVDLGSNNLTINAAGAISGGSAAAYVRTTGTGRLIQNSLGSAGRTGTILFPVGTAADYTPLSINNAGTADNFNVRVIDNVYPKYSSEVPSGTLVSNNVVKKTWFVNEAVAGGSNATLTFQWNGSDEAAGFSRAAAYASHYSTTDNYWQSFSPVGATGSNPYTLAQSGVSSFSPFGVGSSVSILPLQLLSFTGKLVNNAVALDWKTTAEVNTKKFVVQRAMDNGAFVTVGEVNALNTPGENKYAFTDVALAQLSWNNSQYRLQMVDADGKTLQSNILSFVNKSQLPFVTVGSNPFHQQLSLTIYTPSMSNGSVFLYDLNGKKLLQKELNLQTGVNSVQLNTASLVNEVYLLKVQAGGLSYSARVIKINN